MVEGSVRKASNRVRITAQMIDGSTGGHLWAGRYDRDLADVFAVQDDLSGSERDLERTNDFARDLDLLAEVDFGQFTPCQSPLFSCRWDTSVSPSNPAV